MSIRTLVTVCCACFAWIPTVWAQQTAPTLQWQQTYGGAINDILHTVKQTSDGGYVLGGRSIAEPSGTKTAPAYGNYDYWLVRVDANGNQLWDTTFGGSMYDALRNLIQTPDGGFFLAGYTESPPNGNKTAPYFGPRDFWVVRTDANGTKLWEQTYGGSGGETLHVMRPTADGGFILGGTSNSSASGTRTSPNFGFTSRDFWIVRIDANGAVLWDKAYGTTGDDYLQALEVTPDGGFIIGGTSPIGASGNKTSPNHGGPDYWVLRLDASGNILWDKSYGGGTTDDLFAAVPTLDGGFMLAGYSDSPANGTKTASPFGGIDVWVVKVDANGNQEWDKSFGGDSNDNFMDSLTMNRTSDGGFLIGTGTGAVSLNGNKSAANYGGSDMWAIRIDNDGNKLWDLSFGAGDTDVLNSMHETADGGFIFAGPSYSDVGGNKTAPRRGGADYWVVKVGWTNGVPPISSNNVPTLSALANLTLPEDTASAAIPFTIGDLETAAIGLQVHGTSSNPALLPNGQIVFGGTGSNRTLTLTPTLNQTGTTQISVSVTDPHGASTTNAFILTVTPVNDPPTVDPIDELIMAQNSTSGPVAIHISDPETDPAQLQVTVSSSNHDVIHPSGLLLGGSDANRTLQITPLPDRQGTAIVTVTVTDGQTPTSTPFLVRVQNVVVNVANLVSHWKLDELSGPAAADSINTNPGVWTNNPASVPGIIGNALLFNGVNSSVHIPDSDSLDLGTQMSISLWIKPSQLLTPSTGRADVFTKFLSYWLIINYPSGNGKLAFVLNSGTPVVTTTTTEWLQNQWYHIVATYDGAFMRLYVNGALENSAATSVTPAINTSPVQIGGNPAQGQFFPGAIDDVRIYDIPLSPEEVDAIYTSAGIINNPPVIAGLTDQTAEVSSPNLNLAFTVQDNETTAASLLTTASSSNPALIPESGLQLGGSSTNRTLAITPTPGATGQSVVTVTVEDENAARRSLSFTITITRNNQPPTITPIASQIINEDSAAGPILFTIGDEFTPAGNLALTITSSNPALIPPSNLFLSGNGGSHNFSAFPAANASGSTEISITVTDGDGASATNTFTVTVNAVNDRPTLSTLADLELEQGHSAGPLALTVGDIETDASLLTLRAASSDPAVVPVPGIQFGGNGPGRTLSLTATTLLGSSDITVWVSDGALEKSITFKVTVVETNVPVPDTFFITSVNPGTTRNDFNGMAGFGITVGPEPIRVTALARLAYAGNQESHIVRIVDATTGIEVPGASASVSMNGIPTGEWAVQVLPASITLNAGAIYHVLSEERAGGDQFGELNTTIVTTGVASPSSAIYSLGAPSYHPLGSPGQSYGPPNFRYETGASQPPETNTLEKPFVTGRTLGTLRNDFTGFVGMKLTVGSQPVTVTALGRIVAPGNTGTHLLKFVNASDLTDVTGATASVNTLDGAAGMVSYAPLPQPVVLAANTIYYLVSEETQDGDSWHDVVGSTVSTVTDAGVSSGVFVGSGYGWSLAGAPGHAYALLDFKLIENGIPSPAVIPAGDNPAPLNLRAWIFEGTLLVNLLGTAGEHYILEGSNDFNTWTPLANHVLERNEISLVDIDAGNHSHRFYRAVRVE